MRSDGWLETTLRPVLGNAAIARRVLSPEIHDTACISAAIEAANQRFGSSKDADNQAVPASERPVFVLSAGWGSGSTLVQRLLLSSGELYIWGEPYDEAAPVQRLARSVTALRADWPPEKQFGIGLDPKALSERWVANLLPPVEALREAHRAFLSRWLRPPAGTVERWGLKEVRLTVDHAVYLKWLYPQARFLFVHRDPHDAYRSCRRNPWLSIWPSHRATPILAFAHHWQTLAQGFVDRAAEVDALVVAYEDLVSGDYPLARISEFVGCGALDAGLFEHRLGARGASRKPLRAGERLVLDSITGSLRRRLYPDR